ncbi:hypothetical protein KIH77_08905 [Bifidobacterium sp. 82T24]|uniref:hypothetical protein n=1 Tax=Bifidobacterium pluvialisilvae TaxID=2834436 RepID=UPI001C5917F7|nr:hypothetical protein [Bifidobacterium pluvialisilvae]MBW3088839.1 hypothetical protein [Bifidobacterium pluvialisilvae]
MSIVTQPSGNGYAPLWTLAEFRTKFGRDWTDGTVVSVTNAHWEANGIIPIGTRFVKNPGRIDVMFSGNNTAQVRINWVVFFPMA